MCSSKYTMRKTTTDSFLVCKYHSVYRHAVAASLKGTGSKMKLWDIIATCLLLLTSVSARPLFHKLQPSKRAVGETPALDPIIDSRPETTDLKQAFMEEQCKSHKWNDF